MYTILPKMGGGVVRTTARRDFLEFGTRVTIHQPLDVRSVHASTGFAPNISEVHMLDAEGNAVQQINRIRIAKWEEKRPRYISPYGSKMSVRISSLFGYRILNGVREHHAGYDFATARSTKLYSIADDGEVIANRSGAISGQGFGFGWHIIIKYNDPIIGDFCVLYAHLNVQSPLGVGTKVSQGDEVGEEGNSTGGDFSVGIHLHFQTWKGTELNYGTETTVFNPLKDLYDIEMNKDSINDSEMFVLNDPVVYPAERAFLDLFDSNQKLPNRPDIQGRLSGRNIILNDPEVIADTRRILDNQ